MNQGAWIGYRSPDGVFVEAEDVFAYALQRCGVTQIPAFSVQCKEHQEFRDMLLEWFYDGMWDKVYEEVQLEERIGGDGDEVRLCRAG